MSIDWLTDSGFWGGGLVLCGGIAIIIGAIGLVRLPDVYSRIHGAGVIDTAGAALMLAGMLLLSPSWLVGVKVILIGVFLFFTSPIAGHAIANAAHNQGIKPQGRNKIKAMGKKNKGKKS